MGTFKKLVRNFLERSTGYAIERLGSRSFAIIDKVHWIDAWFIYAIQMRSIIENFRIDVVLDVGANEGGFAKTLRSFYGGDIYSFEPVASVFEKLAISAGADPKWYCFNVALGSQESTETINVSDNTKFSSLLKTTNYCSKTFGDVAQGKKKEVVFVKRLDKLLLELLPDIGTKRIFLKMDTQGYDVEVFRGLGNSLRYVMALQSEVSLIPLYEGMPHWTESISVYEKAGFGVVGMFPVNRDSERVIEYDCLMTRIDP